LKDDTGGGVQREAATALGLIGDLFALPFLRDALKSSERDVQKSAAESIERLEKDLKKPPA
jgi:HEAT repeat protein